MKTIPIFCFIAACVPGLTCAEQSLDDRGLAQAMYRSAQTSCDKLAVGTDKLVNLLSLVKTEIRSRLQKGGTVELDRFGVFYMDEVPAKEIVLADGSKERLPSYEVIRFDGWSAVKEKEKELLATGGIAASP